MERSSSGVASLSADDDEPDYDYLDSGGMSGQRSSDGEGRRGSSTLDGSNDPTNFTKPGKDVSVSKQSTSNVVDQYFLGTLIVRVVAARNLEVCVVEQ